MTFNPAIPQATDLISTSQGDILTNFGQLNSIFDLDHYKFNNSVAANRGYHRQVTFKAVLAADPTTGAGTGGTIYSKNVGSPVISQLFYKDSAGVVSQITGGALNPQSIRTGTFTFTWPATSTITYSTPFSTATVSVALTPISGGGAVAAQVVNGSLTAAGFQVIGAGTTQSFYYIAVGY